MLSVIRSLTYSHTPRFNSYTRANLSFYDQFACIDFLVLPMADFPTGNGL